MEKIISTSLAVWGINYFRSPKLSDELRITIFIIKEEKLKEERRWQSKNGVMKGHLFTQKQIGSDTADGVDPAGT